MKLFVFSVIVTAALLGCSDGSSDAYEMSVEEARGKLLGASFERGILPGSSGLRPTVIVSSEGDGSLEWHVSSNDDLAHASGWWCPLEIKPEGQDGKKIRVLNKCRGMLASKDNKNLDELVDATLTGRPPKFDK